MKDTWFRVLLFACLCALWGCTSSTPYRTTIPSIPLSETCQFRDGKPVQPGNEACSVQQHQFLVGHESGPQDYYLGFVEFDDQGWFNQHENIGRQQMEALFRFLYTHDNDFLLVVYAHGWRHNASPCDENVACFRRLLEQLAFMEKYGGDARTVVGIYVGWRGLSISTQPLGFLELPSFWERKNTADRVGHGGVTELLTRLKNFRNYQHYQQNRPNTHLLITGHSFGGQLIYSALSQLLMEKSAETKGYADGKFIYGTANSFGDLVVLINPAFEGSKYQPLYDVATNRCYPQVQRPVMMIVTSKADSATRYAFPAGRWFDTFWERTQSDEQDEAILYTVGHNDQFTTHTLRGEEKARKHREQECGCGYLQDIADLVPQLKNEVDRYSANQSDSNKVLEANAETDYGDGIILKQNAKAGYPPRYPYLVVSTDKRLIPDHNQIYGEDFTNFLRRFYLRHIYFPTRKGMGRNEESKMCEYSEKSSE